MLKQFPPLRNYDTLAIRDLLDARDAYHRHLSHLSNVVATAVGRYRIHKDDWYASHPPTEPRPARYPKVTEEKRLDNSVVKDWSWPCVMVFVREWLKMEDFAASPDQMVPRALYLPDGRIVATCVIRVIPSAGTASRELSLSFPQSVIGGGFAVLSDVQAKEHIGSVGCLVTDGSVTYALTSQHVTGEAGREIYSLLRGERVRVGVSDSRYLRKLPFTRAYPGLAGSNCVSNLDAGLIRVDDAGEWTSQILSVGEPGPPLDLSPDSITLDLIGEPLRSFGGASGEIHGEIQALFYRYKSLGGVDYVADVLIGPQAGEPNDTLPGDSGTVWCRTADKRPVAAQWGAHVFTEDALTAQSYSLATFLSTICRELDLDVLRDHNAGLPEIWGEVGHYSIGAKACTLLNSGKVVSSPNLGILMSKNLPRVGFNDTVLSSAIFDTSDGFFPLADVPDKVWKSGPAGIRRGKEGPTHFADVDRPLPNNPNKNKTLIELCMANPSNINPAFWLDYYDRVNDTSKGLLPFRVQQFYKTMVEALQADPPNIPAFVAAAGIMAHYVGDSCQPLHSSFMHDGDPDDLGPNGKPRAAGVHSAYETKMLSTRASQVITLLNAELENPFPLPLLSSGQEVAEAVVRLMNDVRDVIPPKVLSDAFADDRRVANLWNEFGLLTIQIIAMGVRTLTQIWASAWAEGQGDDRVPESQLKAVAKNKLSAIYESKTFVPSVRLDEIGALL